MPFPNFHGNRRWWTEERVLAGLTALMGEIKGHLPCGDRAYQKIKSGRLDLPPTSRIYGYFGSLPRAWIAAGAPGRRVSMYNVVWSVQEDIFLLDHAGSMLLRDIGRRLHRSYGSVKTRLSKKHHIASRHNQGYFSAAELSKEFQCSCQRVQDLLAAGIIKGRYDNQRNRWDIDLSSLSHEALIALRKPKGTHKSTPTDMGDYYQRHGLRRTLINGRTVCVPA